MFRFVALLSLTALVGTGAALAQTDLGEDFTGAWGSFTSIDTAAANSETPRTPLQNADNRSLGTWGGFWPPAGTGGTAGLFLNNSTAFGADDGSSFRASPAVGAGFLTFPAYTGAEAGAYAYTATFASMDLSGDARIQFDTTLVQTLDSPASVEVRLMLRVPSSPSPPPIAWIISEPISLAGANFTPSFFQNPANWRTPEPGSPEVAAVSVRPEALAWWAFSVPDSALVPLAGGDEAAGAPVGGVIPPAVVSAFLLPQVTGFGIFLETDLTDSGGPPLGQGLWVDAIHLRDEASVLAVPADQIIDYLLGRANPTDLIGYDRNGDLVIDVADAVWSLLRP